MESSNIMYDLADGSTVSFRIICHGFCKLFCHTRLPQNPKERSQFEILGAPP